MEGQHLGMDWPVDVVIAVHRRPYRLMGDHQSEGIYCSAPMTPATGIS